jgi:hypothetical protein
MRQGTNRKGIRMTTEKRTPQLLIDSDADSGYGSETKFLRVFAYPVYWADKQYESDTAGLRNYRSSSWPLEPLADFRISAQADSSDPTKIYGWTVGYRDIFALELREAEVKVKLLRKIDRGLERLQSQYGYPESFAAYVARVGSVLGVKLYGWKAEGNATFMDGNRHRWTDASGISMRLDDLTRDWAKTLA